MLRGTERHPSMYCPSLCRYDRWFKERRAAGIVGRGQARWPHVTG